MDDRRREHLRAGQAAGMRYVLQPPRTGASGAAGALLGKAVGSSVEFMDYREYQPGDDVRTIDWSAYARSDKLMIRLYRQELCPHLDLVLDGSASMALGGTRKAEAAVGLAALLATAADNAGYSHCLFRAAADLAPVPNGQAPCDYWEGLEFDHTGDTGEAFSRPSAPLRPRGVRILLSDLLWPTSPPDVLVRLGHMGSALIVVQLLAREDADGPPSGRLRLVDSETQQVQEIRLDGPARSRYRAALSRHQQLWHAACRAAGAVMVSLVAEDVLADWSVEPLLRRDVLKVS